MRYAAYFLLGFVGALFVGVAHREIESTDNSATIH